MKRGSMSNLRGFLKPSLAALIIVCALSACAPEYDKVTSGSSAPPEGYTQTSYDGCVQSCNNSHIRCLDVSSTRRDARNEAASSIYGARTDCDYALRACLPKCRSR